MESEASPDKHEDSRVLPLARGLGGRGTRLRSKALMKEEHMYTYEIKEYEDGFELHIFKNDICCYRLQADYDILKKGITVEKNEITREIIFQWDDNIKYVAIKRDAFNTIFDIIKSMLPEMSRLAIIKNGLDSLGKLKLEV